MGSKVTEDKIKDEFEKYNGIFTSTEIREFNVFNVVADTYSELIAAIDSIPSKDLTWWSGSYAELGIEGMPRKSNGEWIASLRSEPIGKATKE
ncbi:MAG: hypothetical protein VXA46_06005 [Aquiluna sp.]